MDGGAVDGRQVYPDQFSDQRSPVTRMVSQYIAPTAGQLIGFIRVAATVQVRGRRLDPMSVSSISQLMTSNNISMKSLIDERAHRELEE
jgi:hypothetical protein